MKDKPLHRIRMESLQKDRFLFPVSSNRKCICRCCILNIAIYKTGALLISKLAEILKGLRLINGLPVYGPAIALFHKRKAAVGRIRENE